jgi:hypothetical protein
MNFLEFEELINKIEGVVNSKIVIGDVDISEVHILANTLKSPKQIVRDIESILLASHNYRIDRNKISIAQIRTEDKRAFNRIKFSGVIMKTMDTTIECAVKLTHEEQEYEVSQIGIKTALNKRKIVAGSTIKAVEKILGQAYLFDLQDVMLSSSNDIEFVSILVNMVISGQQEVMVGSAVVKNDINEAIVKATLDAVNRRIEKIST